MTACIIGMPSYTYAVKAEKLLRARGYPCRVQRSDGSSEGCGYELHVRDCEKARSLLDSYRIPYRKIRYGGG